MAFADWTIIDHDFQLTLTIGAPEYAPGESVESLMRRADMALYLGKETARNRVVLDSAPLMRLAAQSKSRSGIMWLRR
jgi:PleD family two-component response regulator